MIDYYSKGKIRVKCANCRMIWDIVPLSSAFIQKCPKCGSNAYDKLDDLKLKQEEK